MLNLIREKTMSKEEVVNTEKQVKVALWNPNAAANWSLLFTPVFGAWLHAENWKTLNEPEKAKKSMQWVYVGISVVIFTVLFSEDLGGIPTFIFLLLWYFTSARKQSKYIQEKEIEYDQKSWQKPLLLGVGGIAVLFCVFFMLGVGFSNEVEKTAKEILNEKILPEARRYSGNEHLECVSVDLGEEFADNNYYAIAVFNDGTKAKLTVQVKGEEVLVQIKEAIEE
jgi:hypothetical protein